MTSYSRRHFLRASAVTAAGVGVLAHGSSLLTHAASARSGKAVTLEYVNRWGKGNDTHYAGMNYLYTTFKQQHPEVSFKQIVLPPGPDAQKDLADCSAGACPDLMNDMTGTFWSDGYLLDLMPYLKADPSWKASFDQPALAFSRTAGHQWGVCVELSPMCAVWNTKVLDQAGVSRLPTTWNELLTTCDKIKRSGKQPMSWAGLYAGGHMFHNLVVGQQGGYAALAANKYDAPQILEALKRLKVFVDNKWVASNEIEQSVSAGFASFQAGRVGFYMNGMWTLKNDITAAGLPADLKNHVAFSALPALSGGTLIENKVATVIGLSAGLHQSPDKLNAALAFLKHFTSRPVAEKWVPLTWSPMGVTVNTKDITGLPALPKQWLSARDHATATFSLPSTRGMQEQQWSDYMTALQTLLTGKSAEAAQAAYVQYMAKYKA